MKRGDIAKAFKSLQWTENPIDRKGIRTYSSRKFGIVFCLGIYNDCVRLLILEGDKTHYPMFNTVREAKEMADNFIIDKICNNIRLEMED